jgi:uncharacterized protein (TIGR02284 family)
MTRTNNKSANSSSSASLPGEGEDRASLDAVLQACADGERGYRAAAKDVRDAGCALMFEHYAGERASFATALRDAAHSRTTGQAHGSKKGTLHRGWLEARAKLTHGSARALVAECARGEDAALHAYREALRANLAPGLREVLQEQYEAIKKAHEELTAVLDADAT